MEKLMLEEKESEIAQLAKNTHEIENAVMIMEKMISLSFYTDMDEEVINARNIIVKLHKEYIKLLRGE